MRAATVVQVLQDLFYVLLHVLFYLWSLLNSGVLFFCCLSALLVIPSTQRSVVTACGQCNVFHPAPPGHTRRWPLSSPAASLSWPPLLYTSRPVTTDTFKDVLMNYLLTPPTFSLSSYLKAKSIKEFVFPLRFCDNFSKRVGNFSTKFHTPIMRSCPRWTTNFYSIVCNFDEVMPY